MQGARLTRHNRDKHGNKDEVPHSELAQFRGKQTVYPLAAAAERGLGRWRQRGRRTSGTVNAVDQPPRHGARFLVVCARSRESQEWRKWEEEQARGQWSRMECHMFPVQTTRNLSYPDPSAYVGQGWVWVRATGGDGDATVGVYRRTLPYYRNVPPVFRVVASPLFCN